MVHLLLILVTAPLSSTLSGPTFLTSFHYNEGEEKTIELLFLARSRYPNVVCEYEMRLELLELSYESTSHESACFYEAASLCTFLLNRLLSRSLKTFKRTDFRVFCTHIRACVRNLKLQVPSAL